MRLQAYYGKPGTRQWENENLVYITLPYPMRLAWEPDVTINRIRVHKKEANKFRNALLSLWNAARMEVKKRVGFKSLSSAEYDVATLQMLQAHDLDRWGGSYAYRTATGSSNLSMHAYGLAMDIDPLGNPWKAKKWTMPDWAVQAICSQGFVWGGTWRNKDCMHYEIKQ